MTLVDAKTSEPVSFATVSLSRDNSKATPKYVLSDADGKAVLEKVTKGKYTLKAEMMGYKPYIQVLEVSKSLDLGQLKMEEDAEVLDAASVSAVGNPIIVKKDTVEYNASSFKTSDNDMLEELLKKLPGVEVGTDGSITANGETIKKITIDGKTFFLDDPSLASKNIPAKIVEKVKVVEKKSDQAMFTGISDGEEETIIDLSLRPGMMQGWFGNVMAGGGHDVPQAKDEIPNDWRYQGAAMVGRFTDKSQISLILNGNNTNNRGFNDMSGTMMGNMRGRGMGRGTGGWGGNGITTSWMGGLNGAFTLLDGNMDLGANYLYNGSNKYIEESSRKLTYRDDGSTLDYSSEGTNSTLSQGHRFGVRLEHKFSESTSILFEPQVNFGNGNFTEYSKFTTGNIAADGTETTVNDGFNENTGKNRNWTTSGFLLFRQRILKPGRTFSVNVNYNFSGNRLDGFNQSLSRTGDDGAMKDDIVNQRYDQTSNTWSVSARAVYTEPLGKGFFLELNYRYGWNKSVSDKLTYNSASDLMSDDAKHLIYNAEGETKDENYTNSISNTYQNHSAGLRLVYQKEKFNAQIGASVNPTITDNLTNGKSYKSTVINWAPNAMLRYDINDNTELRLFYFGRSRQPSTSQLMPVADNSDPLNLSFGNPYLEPYFDHSIRGHFGYTNKKNFTSIFVRYGGGFNDNAIINAKWYDDKGVQFTMPLNGPTSGNADVRLMLNAPIAKSKFSIMNMTYFRYNKSVSYVGKTVTPSSITDDYYDAESGAFDYEGFNQDFFGTAGTPATKKLLDYFDLSNTDGLSFSERIRFTFRNDLVELTLGARTRMNKSWYSINKYNQKATWSNQADASMNWTIPWGIHLIADYRYNWYNGYTTAQPDEHVLNIELSKLLFKDQFTLAVKAYDVLNQSKNLSVTDDSNYHQETRNNTLGRYIVLSLTYRFGNFGGNRGGMRGGPGGHGPGGPRGPRP
ncbi:MAG: outer membrane beta-barrel protein [Candidatus Cryptobacteroides sp.]